MAIEFSCSRCPRQLRVPDESAGKTARCPDCGATTQIPFAAIDAATDGVTFPEMKPPQPQPSPFSDAPAEANPYQSPNIVVDRPAVQPSYSRTADLATRGSRLVAAFVDGIIVMVGAIPAFVMFYDDIAAGRGNPEESIEFMIWIFGGVIAISIIQWALISTSGQSIGKKLMGIRIVRWRTGELPGLLCGVFLRAWVPGVISNIPYIGGCFGLIDILCIFGDDRRCIHDHIAGTKVITVASEKVARGNSSYGGPEQKNPGYYG